MKKIISVIVMLALLCAGAISVTSCASKDKLVVYTESGFAPFEYVSGGKIVGVDIEIMQMVADKLGKELVVENVNFNTIIDAVASGKLANVGAAGISITPQRAEKVQFSNEYYTAKLYVIYKADAAADFESNTTDGVTGIYWDSLAGKNIAVQNGTTADLFLGDELAEDGAIAGSGASKVGFSSLATAVSDVGLNSDVLIIDELPAQQLISGKSEYKCAPLYYKGAEGEADEPAVDTYAICVTKGETEILNAINEVLAELGEDGIQALVNKHLGINQ